MATLKPQFNTSPIVERNLRTYYSDVNALARFVNDRDAKEVEQFNLILDHLDAIRAGTTKLVDVYKLINAKSIETNYSGAELHKAKFYIKTWPISVEEYHLQRSAKLVIMQCFQLLNLPQVREDVFQGKKVFAFSVDEVTPQEAANCFNNNKAIFVGYEVLPNKEAKTSSPKETESKLKALYAQRASRVKR